MSSEAVRRAKLKYKQKMKRVGKWKYLKGDRVAQSRNYNSKYPEKHRAHNAVYLAVKGGKLSKPKVCSVCGSGGRIIAHHPDYSKPTEVIWVCSPCHLVIHK